MTCVVCVVDVADGSIVGCVADVPDGSIVGCVADVPDVPDVVDGCIVDADGVVDVDVDGVGVQFFVGRKFLLGAKN